MDLETEQIKTEEILLAPTEEELDKIEEEEIEYYDSVDYSPSGCAVIAVGLNDKASFFSPFCVKGDEELSPEITEYIMQQEMNLSSREDIEICLFCEKIPSKEMRETMTSALRGKFAETIVQINTSLKRHMLVSIILGLIGIVIQAVDIYFAMMDVVIPYLFLEIFGWVFMWEAVFSVIMVQIPERIRRRRCRNLLRAEIRFRKNEKKLMD